MRLGVFENGWWRDAAARLGVDFVRLPVAKSESGNDYAATLESRVSNGSAVLRALAEQGADLLIDNSGTGLALEHDAATGSLALTHERCGAALCSHFIDPLTTAFQGLDWSVVWQCLQTQSWIKAVWDRATVAELQRMGVPNVFHLPMAAPVRSYDTSPLDPLSCKYSVSFVGGQNTSYFAPGVTAATSQQFAGVLAQAVRADVPSLNFYDVYHDVYKLAEPIRADDDVPTRVRKSAEYYNAKLFHHAALCVRNRDRFAIFLNRALGRMFHLVGTGWDRAYGLPCAPPLPSTDQYFRHFRETAVNINLVNGNAETGLNMRHFEITAAGGFMLCYQQPELAECFDIGKECDVFRSEEELIGKIHYYLSHPEERCAIALAGQKRTLSQHLYSHRLQSILTLLTPKSPVEFSARSCDADFLELLPNPDVILDCGANVGQMARGLRRVYPKATIYSFEPVANVYAQLETAAKELGLIPVRKAVSDRDGTAFINLTTSSEANSLLGFAPGNPCEQWTRVTGREEIEVCTLDRWCQENRVDPCRVGLLKLDVQGAELQALYGARQLLKHVRLVYLEVAFVPIYADCPLFDEVDAFMKECGFRRHAVYPSDQPQNWGDALYVRM